MPANKSHRPKPTRRRFSHSFWLWLGCSLLLTGIFVGNILTFPKSLLFPALGMLVIGQWTVYRLVLHRPLHAVNHSLNSLRQELAELDIYPDFPLGDDHALLLHTGEIVQGIREAVTAEYERELLQKQAQYSALQSQINPHFLYNTLETIRGQALIDGSDEIADMTEALSTFFRYSISQRGNFVSLRDEIENIESYYFIQSCRFGNRINLAVEIEDNAALEYYLPKMTLQPIVENCVQHGLETKCESGEIVIRVVLTRTRLLVYISDNGMGIEEHALREINSKMRNMQTSQVWQIGTGDRHNGIAIFNVNRRLQLLFGASYGLRFASTPDVGTEVEVCLPVLTIQNLPSESEANTFEA